jgi:hypothetical protein
MPNRLRHIDHSEVISLLDDYVTRNRASFGEKREHQARAAAAMLRDLEFLIRSILDTTNALMLVTSLPSPEEIIERLKGDVEVRMTNYPHFLPQ